MVFNSDGEAIFGRTLMALRIRSLVSISRVSLLLYKSCTSIYRII